MNKMTVHLNMFYSSIHNWINCPVQDTHIITVQHRNRSKEHAKVKIRYNIQVISAGVEASSLCSVSTLDRATVFFFLEVQEIQFSPRLMLYHVVDLLVVVQPPK